MKPLYLYFLAASLACTSCSDSWLDLNQPFDLEAASMVVYRFK